ncbi:MAG: flavodoxin family protein [Granulosicoccus sp.]|nr:flavodoxin family protein [Granulosicoccus sp.]
MKRILVLMAHSSPSQSQVNNRMSAAARQLPGVTFVDLYALYPRFKIDIDAEQQRLKEHDVIVFQFPFYWYSTPALLKEWQDLVLEFGFAYGPRGDALAGKSCLVAITTGGAESAYSIHGSNHFSIRTLLTPLEQTARLCQMRFLPPLVLFSAVTASSDGRTERHVQTYSRLLEALRDEQLDLPAAFRQRLLSETELPLLETGATSGTQRHG